MKYRRFILGILLLASVAILAPGCGKIPDTTGASQSPLTFSIPVVAKPTSKSMSYEYVKNQSIPTDYSTDERFSVFALYHNEPFSSLSESYRKDSQKRYMDNVDCAYNSQYNTWDPAKGEGGQGYYWPYISDFRLTFQAYSPSIAQDHMTIQHDFWEGFSFSGFTVRGAGLQYDLLVTRRNPDIQRTSFTPAQGMPYEESGDQGSHVGIDLIFFHTLSLIRFEVNPGFDGDGASAQKILLKSITLLNVHETGDYAQHLASDTAFGNPETSAWTNTSSPKSFVAFSSESGVELHAGWNTDSDPAYAACCNVLMLIPQTMLHSPNNIKLKVDYIKKTGSTESPQSITVDMATGNQGGPFKDAFDNPISSWDIGTRYTYRISLGLHKIFIDPEVEIWQDLGSNTIDL